MGVCFGRQEGAVEPLRAGWPVPLKIEGCTHRDDAEGARGEPGEGAFPASLFAVELPIWLVSEPPNKASGGSRIYGPPATAKLQPHVPPPSAPTRVGCQPAVPRWCHGGLGAAFACIGHLRLGKSCKTSKTRLRPGLKGYAEYRAWHRTSGASPTPLLVTTISPVFAGRTAWVHKYPVHSTQCTVHTLSSCL